MQWPGMAANWPLRGALRFDPSSAGYSSSAAHPWAPEWSLVSSQWASAGRHCLRFSLWNLARWTARLGAGRIRESYVIESLGIVLQLPNACDAGQISSDQILAPIERGSLGRPVRRSRSACAGPGVLQAQPVRPRRGARSTGARGRQGSPAAQRGSTDQGSATRRRARASAG